MSTEMPAIRWDTGTYMVHQKLGNFVQYFQVNLPVNGHGIPTKLISPLPLMAAIADCETTDDVSAPVLSEATLEIEFDGGIPLIDGLPIWERLEGERVEYYKLFKEYREMLYYRGSRAMSQLAKIYDVAPKNISALSKVFHWQVRCKAYDLYKKNELEQKRKFEIQQMQNKHAKAAEKLFERSLQYLEEHPEQLNPKVALEMFQTAIKAGRLALGLDPDKPESTGGGKKAPSINIHNTTQIGTNEAEVVQSSTIEGTSQDGDANATYLQSILHVLDKSGALDQARQGDVIEADFEEVDEATDSQVVEGT